MKLRRLIAALTAAALTAGVTYAYTKPVQDRNQIAFWRTADGQPVGWMTIDYDADGMIAKVVLDGTFGPRTVVFQETNPIFA